MKIGNSEADLTPEEEAITGLKSPLAIYEIDLHGMREAAIADMSRLEKEILWRDDELSAVDVLAALGPEYEQALARKLVLSKVASELATRSGIEKLLDED